MVRRDGRPLVTSGSVGRRLTVDLFMGPEPLMAEERPRLLEDTSSVTSCRLQKHQIRNSEVQWAGGGLAMLRRCWMEEYIKII